MSKGQINVRIPDNTGYGISDIDAKAKKLGITKSELVMKAITLMMNLDDELCSKIQIYSKSANIPEWVVIQNLLIETMASRAAKIELGTFIGEDATLVKIVTVPDGSDGVKIATPAEYFNALKHDFLIKEKMQNKKTKKDEDQH
jgi:hypothetical protein